MFADQVGRATARLRHFNKSTNANKFRAYPADPSGVAPEQFRDGLWWKSEGNSGLAALKVDERRPDLLQIAGVRQASGSPATLRHLSNQTAQASGKRLLLVPFMQFSVAGVAHPDHEQRTGIIGMVHL